jgi:hypothetical protein
MHERQSRENSTQMRRIRNSARHDNPEDGQTDSDPKQRSSANRDGEHKEEQQSDLPLGKHGGECGHQTEGARRSAHDRTTKITGNGPEVK